MLSLSFLNTLVSASFSFNLICKVTTFSSLFSSFCATSKWFFFSVLIFCNRRLIFSSFASQNCLCVSNSLKRSCFTSSTQRFSFSANFNKDPTWLKLSWSLDRLLNVSSNCLSKLSFCSTSNLSKKLASSNFLIFNCVLFNSSKIFSFSSSFLFCRWSKSDTALAILPSISFNSSTRCSKAFVNWDIFSSSAVLSYSSFFKSCLSFASLSPDSWIRVAILTRMSSKSFSEFSNALFKTAILSSFFCNARRYFTAFSWILAFNFSATFSRSLNPTSDDWMISLISLT